jgi:hypothetical protein
MSKKKRTFEAEILALEGVEIRKRKGDKKDEASHTRHGENLTGVADIGPGFPFSRELVLRVIDRIKND